REKSDECGVEFETLDQRLRCLRRPLIVLGGVVRPARRSADDEGETLLRERHPDREEQNRSRQQDAQLHRSPQRRRSNHSDTSNPRIAAKDHPVCHNSWVTASRAAGAAVRSSSAIAAPSLAEMSRPPERSASRCSTCWLSRGSTISGSEPPISI